VPPFLYHLAIASDLDAARTVGEYRMSTVDRTLEDEGFIHCSFADQVEATAARFYAGRDDVMVLTIDEARVPSEIRVEGGFPHVYGPLPIDAVVDVAPFGRGAQ
jgi:uncharacterized protein (DUF952 family)